MSIRLNIIFKIALIVTAVCAANLGLNLALTQMSLSKISEKEMGVVTDMADKYISSAIELLKSDATVAAGALEDEPDETLPAAVKFELYQATRFIGLAVLEKEHVIAAVGHDPASAGVFDSEYARRAMNGERVISSTTMASDGILVFYVFAPMSGGRILVATVDGRHFSNLLSQFTLWKSGNLFMADREGTFIACYIEDWVAQRRNFIELARTNREFESVGGFVRRMISHEPYSGSFDYQGTTWLGVATPVRGSLMGWTLAAVAPVSESPMVQVRNVLLATSLAAFIVCLGIAVFASRYIARPIAVIDEQNIRLAELKEEAEYASRIKSSFLANTSHEMRTPLNAIIGLADLALNEEKPDPEFVRENLKKISNSGMTLLGIINDLLDISKIESGKFELIEASYDVPSIINDTVSLNIIRIGSKPIEFRLDIDGELPARLVGDELRIKQIFNNLLSNAFKYTKEGSVSWRLAYEGAPTLAPSGAALPPEGVSPPWGGPAAGEDGWLVASVRDTGIGIRPEDLRKLFADYNQVDVHTNHAIEGTGLGLAVVKRLAELMGGQASVESVYGEGSTFTVRIPQKRDGADVLGAEAADNLRNFRYTDNKRNAGALLVRAFLPDARVLIVDDVSTNLDVAKGLMKPYGMQIVCVTSGRQAIERIRAGEHFDAVFMDHMMPEMDGIEAVRIIREEISTDYAREVPIIALTANAIVGNEKMFLEHGFQAFLSKPIDILKLDAAIQQWIKSRFKGRADDQLPAPARLPRLDPAFNLSVFGFSVEEGLARFGGDSEVLLDVLRSYAASTPGLLEKLKVSEVKQDLEAYAVTVHGIKGSSRGIGARALGDEAEALEKAARAGDLAFVHSRNEEFVGQVRNFLEELNKLLATARGESEKPPADAPDPALLVQLRAACEGFCMDDAERAITELERYDYRTGNERVARLRQRLDRMEFEAMADELANNDER
jgi:signal transduction histidine kinase/CheY-like chemotaxis protein/HPt (histidine-containing phosphotransfer) domain-containing protein